MVWGAIILMRGAQCRTIYKLSGGNVIDGCNNTIVPESKNEESKVPDISRGDTMLWHQRLGHIGEKGLQSLQGKGMVEVMSNYNLDFDFCEHCLYGKHNWVKFPSGATSKKAILELIQSDVFGPVPVPVPLLGVSLYYVRFIDDFSRNTCLYFLKNKLEVFNKFKEFKVPVENQIGNNINVMRTDNSGEFYQKEFE